jgi:glutathione S-transferase
VRKIFTTPLIRLLFASQKIRPYFSCFSFLLVRSFLPHSSTHSIAMTTTKTTSPPPPAPAAALFEGDTLWEDHWKEGAGEATLKRRMQTPSNPPQLILYSSWFCPFAQRAWIAAEESGVNYQWIEINPYYVNPQQPGGYTKKAMTLPEKDALYPDFIQASPRGLVPAILHVNDKVVLWESLPVSEYIDACFGNGALMSLRRRNTAQDDDDDAKNHHPYEVARLQIWSAHCTDRIQKKFYQALTAEPDSAIQASLVQVFYQECRVLAQAMRTTYVENGEGYYFNGTEFSIVDVALAPFWQRFLVVGQHYLGAAFALPLLGMDEKGKEPEFQRLAQWWKAVSARPSVAATLVCEPRLVANYQDYARNVATSDAARNYFN